MEAAATDWTAATGRVDALVGTGDLSYNDLMQAAQNEISALAARHGERVRREVMARMLGGGLSKWRALADALVTEFAAIDVPDGAKARFTFDPVDSEYDLRYDANGNLTSVWSAGGAAQLVSLAYTPDNRLATVTYIPDNPDTVVGQYKYDAFGRRVSKQAYDDEVVKFAYDLSGNMIYEFETSGDQLYKEYLYINGLRVLMIAPDGAGQLGGCATADGLEFVWVSLLGVGAVLLVLRRRRNGTVFLLLGGMVACGDVVTHQRVQSALTGSDGFYFYHEDHIGMPHVLTDYQGTAVWSATYTDFGEDISITGPSSYVQNFRFPGQYMDWETGLYYNMNRYYFPAMGRYVTADLIGNVEIFGKTVSSLLQHNKSPNIINMYSYATNAPQRYVDFFGLSCSENCPDCPGGRWVGHSGGISYGGFVWVVGAVRHKYCYECTYKKNVMDKFCVDMTCYMLGASPEARPIIGASPVTTICDAPCKEIAKGKALGLGFWVSSPWGMGSAGSITSCAGGVDGGYGPTGAGGMWCGEW